MLALVPRDEKLRIETRVRSSPAAPRSLLAAKLGFGPVERTKVATAVSGSPATSSCTRRPADSGFSVSLTPRIGLAVEGPRLRTGYRRYRNHPPAQLSLQDRPGHGLRGVKSISQDFQLQSTPGQGTRVKAIFYSPSSGRWLCMSRQTPGTTLLASRRRIEVSR